MTSFVFNPPLLPTLPIIGSEQRFPLRRIYCVGRNYAAHAAEMNASVDKTSARPFYFTKSSYALCASGACVPYPPETQNFQHEVELVVALQAPAYQIDATATHDVIFGYAVGLDMTRRDLQQAARAEGKPWDIGKDFDNAAVCSALLRKDPAAAIISSGEISLRVNGAVKQRSDLAQMIWNVNELIADLSQYYHLDAGDLIYTGTPEGVGPVRAGDKLIGRIEGVGEVRLEIGEKE